MRIPLSRVAVQVELMVDGATGDQQRELREIRAHCAAMDDIIDTVMAAARSELTGAAGRSSVAAVLGSFADRSGRPVVVVDAPTLPVGVDDAVVTRMLAPVVDNARRPSWLSRCSNPGSRPGRTVMTASGSRSGRADVTEV